jgi:hypothetical protein
MILWNCCLSATWTHDMTTDVVYFDSTMSGAPALSNTAGTLIAVLDAGLVNGFGSVTLDTLAVSGNVATGTISTGHNLTLIGSTGPVIEIGGATPSALNGRWRVASIPSGTQFTFATSGISNQTATGTITAKRPPAGFEKAFSGTNLAAYRSLNVEGTRLYCRIDDTAANFARICGYETMSDVNTGTGLFPTDAQISGGGYIYKANSTNRSWKLMSDGRLIYFFCDSIGSNNWTGGFVFGDIDSYRAADAYGAILISTTGAASSLDLYRLASVTGSYIARTHTQLGTSVTSARYSHGKSSTSLGVGGQSYPAPVDNRTHLWPIECWEGTTLARGLMPGLWCPTHTDVPNNLAIENIPQLPGRTLLVQMTGTTAYRCVIDLTGPWR